MNVLKLSPRQFIAHTRLLGMCIDVGLSFVDMYYFDNGRIYKFALYHFNQKVLIVTLILKNCTYELQSFQNLCYTVSPFDFMSACNSYPCVKSSDVGIIKRCLNFSLTKYRRLYQNSIIPTSNYK